MSALTLHAHEVRRLLSHGSVLLVRPVKPQPDDDWMMFATKTWGTDNTMPIRGDREIRCPLGAPGTEHWVRETWAACLHPEDPVQPGMAMCVEDGKVVGPPRWHPDLPREMRREMFRQWTIRSPVTMPRWASRCDVTVRDVRMVRVGDLSEDDMRMTMDKPLWYTEVGGKKHYWPIDFSVKTTWNYRYRKQPEYAWPGAWAWAVTVARTPD